MRTPKQPPAAFHAVNDIVYRLQVAAQDAQNHANYANGLEDYAGAHMWDIRRDELMAYARAYVQELASVEEW